MKVAILGGGFTGLAASYYLAKKGHDVTLFEKEGVLGGLAVGFKRPDWDWYLERAIHHLLANDDDIVNFAKDLGFDKIFYQPAETASLYPASQRHSRLDRESDPHFHEDDNYRIIPLDSPQDLLSFPYLSLFEKLRAGSVLAALKFSPPLKFYETQTAQEFITQFMGKRAWEVLWQELFRKKFGKYAGNILASFIWARIKKRAKNLGYIEGGFQTLINHAEKEIGKLKVEVRKGTTVESIVEKGRKLQLVYSSSNNNGHSGKRVERAHPESGDADSGQARMTTKTGLFDSVISTLPTPVLTKISQNLLPKNYLDNLSKIKYQHAISLILEAKEPFLEKAYWLSNCAPDNPIMGLFQQTNFIDKKHYGGKHILYVGNYVDFEDPRVRMSDQEILAWYTPHLKKINPKFDIRNAKFFVFKGPFAQPIFDKQFLKSKPDFITPVKNFYIANLDMTYPYDRGTNYAVKLGKEVSGFF